MIFQFASCFTCLCMRALWHCGTEKEKIQVHMEHLRSTVLASVGISWWLRLNFESMSPARALLAGRSLESEWAPGACWVGGNFPPSPLSSFSWSTSYIYTRQTNKRIKQFNLYTWRSHKNGTPEVTKADCFYNSFRQRKIICEVNKTKGLVLVVAD